MDEGEVKGGGKIAVKSCNLMVENRRKTSRIVEGICGVGMRVRVRVFEVAS